MGVIRRADGDDVNLVTEGIEHLTEVGELASLGKLTRFLVEGSPIDVTEPDDFDSLLGNVAGVTAPLPTNADAGGGKPL